MERKFLSWSCYPSLFWFWFISLAWIIIVADGFIFYVCGSARRTLWKLLFYMKILLPLPFLVSTANNTWSTWTFLQITVSNFLKMKFQKKYKSRRFLYIKNTQSFLSKIMWLLVSVERASSSCTTTILFYLL